MIVSKIRIRNICCSRRRSRDRHLRRPRRGGSRRPRADSVNRLLPPITFTLLYADRHRVRARGRERSHFVKSIQCRERVHSNPPTTSWANRREGSSPNEKRRRVRREIEVLVLGFIERELLGIVPGSRRGRARSALERCCGSDGLWNTRASLHRERTSPSPLQSVLNSFAISS